MQTITVKLNRQALRSSECKKDSIVVYRMLYTYCLRTDFHILNGAIVLFHHHFYGTAYIKLNH